MEFSDQTLSSVPDPAVFNGFEKKIEAITLECGIQGTGQIKDFAASSAQAHSRYLSTSESNPNERSKFIVILLLYFPRL